MGRLDGRVAIVTGAGRGLGRAHALRLAAEGARVVVNDLGAGVHGEGAAAGPAHEVVEEIRAAGGEAVASAEDVSDWAAAAALIRGAVEAFGRLDVLVNNAGILRDRTLANLSEAEWDAVVRVHLKGHAAPTAHAFAHWRERARAGGEVRASVIHTSSVAAFAANFGQAAYGAAKLGIIGLSAVAALEGRRIGVRSNVVAPSARTRLALEGTPEAERFFEATRTPDFDPWDPANVSPLVAWLAEAGCPATSQIFQLSGRRLRVVSMPSAVHDLESDGRWTPEELDRRLPSALLEPVPIESLLVF